MSIGKIGKVVRTALDRAPGSGSVQRLIDKARGTPTKTELELKSVLQNKDLIEIDDGVSVAPVELDREEIQKLCDVSGLKRNHQQRLHGYLPDLPYKRRDPNRFNPFIKCGYETFKYQRRLYARYGEESNIHPGKLWPTPEELESLIEVSSMRYVMTAEALLQKAQENKEAEEQKLKEIRDRDEEVAANFLKVAPLKEKLYMEALEIDKQCDEAQAKRNKRIEKVRKYFSYAMSVKDPRFKEKMSEFIQAEKDKVRNAQKAAKKAKLEARRQAKLEAA